MKRFPWAITDKIFNYPSIKIFIWGRIFFQKFSLPIFQKIFWKFFSENFFRKFFLKKIVEKNFFEIFCRKNFLKKIREKIFLENFWYKKFQNKKNHEKFFWVKFFENVKFFGNLILLKNQIFDLRGQISLVWSFYIFRINHIKKSFFTLKLNKRRYIKGYRGTKNWRKKKTRWIFI